VSKAENLTTLMCRLSRNLGALSSRTPQGHVGLFRGYFTFYLLEVGIIVENIAVMVPLIGAGDTGIFVGCRVSIR
jgi:hypothetical protein